MTKPRPFDRLTARLPQKTAPTAADSFLEDPPAEATVLRSVFTYAAAIRLTAESAGWPLPSFPDGPGAAARKAILERSGWTCDEAWRKA